MKNKSERDFLKNVSVCLKNQKVQKFFTLIRWFDGRIMVRLKNTIKEWIT
ncbi:hypothetical protein D920_01848 [Enterococcus faecalis 13-SD-W-01]|nr:hypothetical protein D920_01848 [Enterococcus faecalis 13-SD-W-01]